MMDIVFLWKEVSIATTGFFGILALLTEFKDKETKRVTSWGKISLAGIVVSTLGGALAQYKELSDNEVASRKASEATLRIVSNTSAAITGIERILTQIEEPKVSMSFRLPCEEARLTQFCRSLITSEAQTTRGHPDLWSKWPFRRYDNKVSLHVLAALMKPDRAAYYRRGELPLFVSGDLQFYMEVSSAPGDEELSASVVGNDVFLAFSGNKPRVANNGRIVGLSDFPGATIFVHEFRGFEGVEPVPIEFKLYTKNGRAIYSSSSLAPQSFETVVVRDTRLFAHTFKDE